MMSSSNHCGGDGGGGGGGSGGDTDSILEIKTTQEDCSKPQHVHHSRGRVSQISTNP